MDLNIPGIHSAFEPRKQLFCYSKVDSCLKATYKHRDIDKMMIYKTIVWEKLLKYIISDSEVPSLSSCQRIFLLMQSRLKKIAFFTDWVFLDLGITT